MNEAKPPGECFYGSVTVGERGQIVIPAEARAELNVKPGDKLLVLRHPVYEGLMIAKFEVMSAFFEEMTSMIRTHMEGQE